MQPEADEGEIVFMAAAEGSDDGDMRVLVLVEGLLGSHVCRTKDDDWRCVVCKYTL